MMTPGPARRIVTLLPKKRPTPIAPPMASMLSWRWVSLRRSSPPGEAWPGGGSAAAGARRCAESGASAMFVQIEQDIAEAADLLDGVVVHGGNAHHAGVRADAETIHQAGRVHVAIADSDFLPRHGLGYFGGRHVLQIETDSGDALVDAFDFLHAINGGIARPQYAQ